VGKAMYMSSEQASGSALDARTDTFRLGVVVYELVAGRLPFEGSTSREMMASLLSEREPQPLARYSSDRLCNLKIRLDGEKHRFGPRTICTIRKGFVLIDRSPCVLTVVIEKR
jgi:serine/threonine protein kinase